MWINYDDSFAKLNMAMSVFGEIKNLRKFGSESEI